MAMYKTLSTSTVIPWRLRHGLERWLESSCRDHRPGLYRWMHFGEARDRLSAVTSGPKHHFFGYYDKCPWNASATLLLAHEAAFNDRPPGAEDKVTIGVVSLGDRNRFQPLATSRAWNWQQGSMLQCLPRDGMPTASTLRACRLTAPDTVTPVLPIAGQPIPTRGTMAFTAWICFRAL